MRETTETGCEDLEWIYLAQDGVPWRALLNTVMNLRVLWEAGNFLTSRTTVSFARRNRLLLSPQRGGYEDDRRCTSVVKWMNHWFP